MDKFEYITVGSIGGPFGVHGQIKVVSQTDFPERFLVIKRLFLLHESQLLEKQVSDVELQPGRVLLKLSGIETPEVVRRYNGDLLQVPISEAWLLPKGSYYHHQIVGLTVYTEEGVFLGQVSDVLPTGSNDVYQVSDPDRGKEYLIPALKSVVIVIDLDKQRMVIRPLPGMLE